MATSKARALVLQLLVTVGTCALLVLIVVLVTGGFVLDAGPLHLSARRWTGPLLVVLLAWIAAALYGRPSLADTTASVATFIDRYATALTVVIAAATAGAGVAYGTYAASGADAAGYVSQAELLASARIIRDEPLARQAAWRDATWAFSPLGYRPGPNTGEIVPTYSPGLPLTMAGALLAGGELGLFPRVRRHWRSARQRD